MIDDDLKNENSYNAAPPSRGKVWTAVLGAGVLLLGGFAFYQSNRTDELKQQIAAAQHDNASLQTSFSSSVDQMQKTIDSLKTDLKSDLAANSTTVSKNLARTQANATRHADQLAAQLEQKRAQDEQQLTSALNDVKTANDETSSKLTGISSDVGDVRNDVGSVKTDVASVRSDTNKNASDLQRALGDMGVMSGLIATNGDEIKMLRALGDRNVYEFTLTRSQGMQKVGDIQVALNKADPKRNRFTLDILADDKKVQKRDKGTNEPVQFYVPSKARQPYELVVNQVDKNTVKGYLATPKVSVSRNDEPAKAN
jgi:hypothetical protein